MGSNSRALLVSLASLVALVVVAAVIWHAYELHRIADAKEATVCIRAEENLALTPGGGGFTSPGESAGVDTEQLSAGVRRCLR